MRRVPQRIRAAAHGVRAQAGNSAIRRLGLQSGWVFGSRLIWAVLQLLILIVLARALRPIEFAKITTVLVVLNFVTGLNGLGLGRQIQLIRARDPQDPSLAAVFSLRLVFTHVSALAWLLTCLTVYAVTGSSLVLAFTPLALWLEFEQTTSVWNGVSIVDGRAHDLMVSYLWRRVPVLVGVALAAWLEWDVVWGWSVSLALGSVLAYAQAWHQQEPWARIQRPTNWSLRRTGLDLDFAYWWSLLGGHIRELEMAALLALSPAVAAIYAFPARMVGPMGMVSSSIGTAAFPALVRRRLLPRRHVAVGVMGALLPLAVFAGALALAAPWAVPTLAGEEYRPGVPILQLLCIAAVLLGAGNLVSIVLQARTRSANRAAGKINLIGGVLQVVLVAAGGLVSASWAASGAIASQLLLLILLAGFIWRRPASLHAP